MTNFSGTGVAVVTPFNHERQVDQKSLRRVIRHLIAGKVEYLVALGTTGESVTLTEAESSLVLDTFFEEAGDKIPVVIGVGGNDTAKVCVKAARTGTQYPAAGLLSVSPYYNKPSQEGIFRHYEALAGSTDLPIILYNVPGRTASNIEAGTVLRLAELPNIVAVKEASGNLEQGMAIIAGKPEGFQVLSGDDLLGLAQISLGYEGVISVMGNAFPLEYSEMVRLALAGDFAGARQLQYQLRVLMALNFAEGNPNGVKALMMLKGICEPFVRLPLVEATSGLVDRMKKELASMHA